MITLEQYAQILVQNGILSADSSSWPNINMMLDDIKMTEAKSATMTKPVEMNRNSLTEAMNFYCEVGSKIINGYFRTNKELQLNKYISECVRVLMHYSNATIYSAGKTLYHGRNLDSFLSKYGLQWETMDYLKGRRITIPGGFISASAVKSKAEAFSDNLASGYPMILKIETPNPFNAIHRTMGSYADEEEYILPPDTIYYVTSVIQDKWGRIIVTADIAGVQHNGKTFNAEQNSRLYIAKLKNMKNAIAKANENKAVTNSASNTSNTSSVKTQLLDKLAKSAAGTLQNKLGAKVIKVQSDNNARTIVTNHAVSGYTVPVNIVFSFDNNQGNMVTFHGEIEEFMPMYSDACTVNVSLNNKEDLEKIKSIVLNTLKAFGRLKAENKIHAA